MKKTSSMVLLCAFISGLLVGITRTSGLETPGYQRLWGNEYNYASGDVMASPVFTEGVRLSDGWWVDGEVWYRFEMPSPPDAFTSLNVGVYGVASNSTHGDGDGVDVYVWNVATDTWDYVGTTGMGEGPNYWTVDPVNHIHPVHPYEFSIRVYAHDIDMAWGIDDIYDLWYIDTSYTVEEFGWLEGTVTDVETGLPIIGGNVSGISIEYMFFAETNASGQYRVELLPGTYNITAEKPGYESENVVLDVIAYTTTTQNFALHSVGPPMRELSIEIHGEGTTVPSPGVHLIPEGEQVAVEALPDYDWVLDHWMLDDVNVGDANPLFVNMDTDHLLLCVFAEELPPLEAEIESCNPDGGRQDYYDLGETVYVAGGGYSPSSTYDFYVVEDVDLWIDGMAIPERVPETAATLSPNTEGQIVPTGVWLYPQTVGKYDIVVDVNGNGQYDVEIDALDDNDIEVTAGFVIPEFPPFFIPPLFVVVTVLVVIVYRKKHSTRAHLQREPYF